LINAEVSEEGPEYNFEVKDDKNTVHIKRLKIKLSKVTFVKIRFVRMTSYPVPTDVKNKLKLF